MSEGVMFYRCELCRGIVSKWDISTHLGCPKCGQRRIRPSNLSFFEKIVQLWKHPKFWAWEDTQPSNMEEM